MTEKICPCNLGPCTEGYERCDGLDVDIYHLMQGTEEGTYDTRQMAWTGPNGDRHSQRCNARNIVENSTSSDTL